MKNSLMLQALKGVLQEQAPLRARRSLGVLPGVSPALSLHSGQVIEVLGEGRWAYGVRLMKACPESRVAWVSAGALPLFPMALAQEGVSLSRLLFLARVSPEASVEILLAILRSGLFEWVVMEQVLLPRVRQDVQVRKLQLLAEEQGSGIVLLSEVQTASFGVQVRIETGGPQGVRIGKVKGGI